MTFASTQLWRKGCEFTVAYLLGDKYKDEAERLSPVAGKRDYTNTQAERKWEVVSWKMRTGKVLGN